MKSNPCLFFRALSLSAAFLIAAVGPAVAQTTSVGTVEGRVLNADNGRYLPNARVTVQ